MDEGDLRIASFRDWIQFGGGESRDCDMKVFLYRIV